MAAYCSAPGGGFDDFLSDEEDGRTITQEDTADFTSVDWNSPLLYDNIRYDDTPNDVELWFKPCPALDEARR